MAEKFNISFEQRGQELVIGYPLINLDINVNGRKCGWIQAPTWNYKEWHVRIAVQSDTTRESPCDFKWMHPDTSFATEQQAREWVKASLKSIHDKHPLFFFDDDE